MITFSSSACYPVELQSHKRNRLLKEEDISFNKNIGMPDMTYGWAKLTCEYLGQIAYEKYGIKSVCYRPFSVMEKIKTKFIFSKYLQKNFK